MCYKVINLVLGLEVFHYKNIIANYKKEVIARLDIKQEL